VDYFTRLDPEPAMRRIIRQANALAFTFDSTPSQPSNPRTPVDRLHPSTIYTWPLDLLPSWTSTSKPTPAKTQDR